MSAPPAAPWAVAVDETVARLDTDVGRGLTDDEVADRLRRDGPNELVEAPPVPLSQRILAQFDDPLVALLLAAIVISSVAWVAEGAEGFPIEPSVIASIVLLNAALGLWQELRTARAVAVLKDLSAPHALVVRDGRVVRVQSAGLVVGDVVVLEEGAAVSADCRVVDATGLDVAEAPLTGESQPVTKVTAPLPTDTPLADRANMVFSGTAITRGHGRALVVATGMGTEIGRIADLLGTADSGETPLQRQISWLGKMLGLLVVGLSVVVVGSVLLTSDDRSFTGVIDALVVGVSLAVAAVPEGLLAIMSVVLALGVQRMAEHGAIVKRLSSVETLGSASVICTDKTGTLTRNEMTIVAAVVGDVEIEITGVGYRPVGNAVVDGKRLQGGALAADLRYLLTSGALSSDAMIESNGNGQWEVHGDPTEIAFLVAEQKLADVAVRTARFDRIDVVPFTSERKMMTTLQRDGDDERMLVISKGAPDVLLGRCDRERIDDDDVALTDERRAALMAIVNGLADRALRTLAVAYRELDRTSRTIGPGDEDGLVWLGVVGMVDPPRDEVADSIREAHSAGIRVVMITGDHPRTAQRIAEQLDVDTVHARVEPDDKLRIVRDLQDAGNVVSMT
ncbi:MAG: haloacid dehalogenase, partial [Acidimicrobiaceae bacterium]|nr:haloacid dehalogenase [Acidimicrobiaceae bacterium]